MSHPQSGWRLLKSPTYTAGYGREGSGLELGEVSGRKCPTPTHVMLGQEANVTQEVHACSVLVNITSREPVDLPPAVGPICAIHNSLTLHWLKLTNGNYMTTDTPPLLFAVSAVRMGPGYESGPAPIWSTLDQQWFGISIEIGSSSTALQM